MLAKAISLTALCLMVTACGGLPMDSVGDGAATSGSSDSSPTSYQSGYGIGSGASDENTDGRMSWSE
jgi:hypothetical protein